MSKSRLLLDKEIEIASRRLQTKSEGCKIVLRLVLHLY